MSLLFIVQLSVSIGALAITQEQQHDILEKTWQTFNLNEKADLQNTGDCCGFQDQNITQKSHPTCTGVSSHKGPQTVVADRNNFEKI